MEIKRKNPKTYKIHAKSTVQTSVFISMKESTSCELDEKKIKCRVKVDMTKSSGRNIFSAHPIDSKQRWGSHKFLVNLEMLCHSIQVQLKEHSVDLIKLHYQALFISIPIWIFHVIT